MLLCKIFHFHVVHVFLELPDIQVGFRKIRGTKDQIANIHWIIEKARQFQKNICFCFINHAKAFDCMDHNKLWKIFQEIGIPDYLTCLLEISQGEISPASYAGQEAIVRTEHRTTDWFQIGKGVHQGCILSSYSRVVFCFLRQSTLCIWRVYLSQ